MKLGVQSKYLWKSDRLVMTGWFTQYVVHIEAVERVRARHTPPFTLTTKCSLLGTLHHFRMDHSGNYYVYFTVQQILKFPHGLTATLDASTNVLCSFGTVNITPFPRTANPNSSTWSRFEGDLLQAEEINCNNLKGVWVWVPQVWHNSCRNHLHGAYM